ncbi:Transposon Ty3-I Gag-Pol polyprotein [Vitis vinifera]|uniref:Transposon Ty3-I Gag-Pol polyprotein n=1 Tax=Vitis vinifera TaxID=29760 RepID=A0A438KAH5_VITVI|nr:Transposon Ty3-I Gag-Pol polyprotein [Vitis vinifera]
MTPAKKQKLLRAASIRERINSIRPGLTGGGPRPIDGTIIFPPVDPTRTLQPHRDALILSLEIGDFDVRRILVDPGSSADLVQASVVSHMGHSLTGLKTLDESCPDSTGHQLLPWETFTTGPSWPSHSQRTIFGGTRFITFNVILGRTWLHYMKAIPSTYHQMVSFLTKDGQINLYGSQLAARQCYQIARETGTSQEDASLPESSNRMTNSNYWVRWTKIPRQQIPCKQSKFRKKKVRRFHPDRQKIIRIEIDKLLEAGFIREVDYPDWLANVVVVPKKEGKWRVCVDYTNLNNACPKDSFPLPRIDQIVDSTAGQGMLSFLDAFSGYHQIPMSPADEEKTAFITPHDLIATKPHGRALANSWVYGQPKGHRGQSGSSQGSHRNTTTRNKKELQRLTGKLVALGPAHPEQPHPKEKLYMYLAVSEWAISAVLFRCPSPKEQKPIYYVSRALADVETRYSKMELTALALRSAAQKLRPYFQAHPVVVLTDQPLRNILHKPDLTGRMLQWAIELSEFGIEFQPRLSMKGQVMADFVLEYSRKPSQRQESSEKEWWTLRVDGASRSSGSGVGLLLQSPTGEHLEQAIRLGFPASNNEAEYEPSYPDWTSLWLYPSPSSGSIAIRNS